MMFTVYSLMFFAGSVWLSFSFSLGVNRPLKCPSDLDYHMQKSPDSEYIIYLISTVSMRGGLKYNFDVSIISHCIGFFRVGQLRLIYYKIVTVLGKSLPEFLEPAVADLYTKMLAAPPSLIFFIFIQYSVKLSPPSQPPSVKSWICRSRGTEICFQLS